MFFPIHGNKDIRRTKNVDLLVSFKHCKVDKKYWDQAKRYVIYLYDSGSPVRPKSTTLHEAKQFAAELAGFDLEKDAKFLDRVFKNQDDDVLDMIHDVLRSQKNRKWSIICTFEENFYEFQRRALEETADERDKDLLTALEKKGKLLDLMESLDQRLTRLTSEFYEEDEELEEAIRRRSSSPEARIADV